MGASRKDPPNLNWRRIGRSFLEEAVPRLDMKEKMRQREGRPESQAGRIICAKVGAGKVRWATFF